MSPAGMRFPQGTRSFRTRFVLLALPASIVLLLLTSAFYWRDLSSQRTSEHFNSKSVPSPSEWTGEQQQRRERCWAQWVSTGNVCRDPPHYWSRQDRLDLVWTWNNASATSTSSSSAHSSQSHSASSDLLRYSFRSAQRYMQSGFGTVTLLTPDVAMAASSDSATCTHAYTDSHGIPHTGQRPCWLSTADAVYEPPSLLHHSQVACADESGLDKDTCSHASTVTAADALLLAAVAPELTEVRLAVSPHHIFAAPVSSSDFWSPLYGSIFRLSADAEADDIPTTNPDAVGTLAEDAPIIRANALLDRRFGSRPRRKLLDLPQPFSKAIVAELQQAWPNHLGRSSTTSARNLIDLATLHAHYMAERHREALLWSFLVAKHDRDADGVYSSQEATALLRDLGVNDVHKPTFPVVSVPIRSSVDKSTVASNLRRASLTAGLSHQFLQSSIDGSAMYVPRPSAGSVLGSGNVGSDANAAGQANDTIACQLETECVEPLLVAGGKPSVSEFFSRVAYLAPVCGDCMLMHLVGKSGLQGLSAFLPDEELVMPSLASLPSPSTFEQVDVSIKPSSGNDEKRRLDVVAGLLARYTHSVIIEETFVTPHMPNRSATAESLSTLEFFNVSSVFGFKQHGSASPEPRAEDAWIWIKYVRAWLSVRYPLAMRFESHTTEL
ncbi:conserved hypothetical protein [Sporisorium reilianum SRZ2]|uniref:EF-hand domain-containing protein n=1 Tax=Sporisorium reilianum (strain SRZ2) TaxID=999809 RepID=E6ZQZ2_SPORE|nr:conserved hypothetical protein [Sporisorium reilianum SRZ2]